MARAAHLSLQRWCQAVTMVDDPAVGKLLEALAKLGGFGESLPSIVG